MSVVAVLVNYFGASDTALAARSVLADAPDTELVVVDNSVDAAERQRLQALLPASAQVLLSAANVGFGQACNRAIEATRAGYVFLVNPDVRVLPGCTQALAAALDADGALAAVAPRQYLDHDCQWLLPPSWLPTSLGVWASERAQRNGRDWLRLDAARRAEALRCWTARQPLRQRALSGAAMLFRRTAMAVTEPVFDPRFFMYFEDSDLCQRLRRRSGQLALVPAARAIHGWRNAPAKAALMAQGGAVYFDKYGGSQNRWQQQAARLRALPLLPWSDHYQAMPRSGVTVPPAWQDAWLLELGLNEWLHPAVGWLGRGPRVDFPESLLSQAEGARIYARLGPVEPNAGTDNPRLFWLDAQCQ